MKTYYFPVGFRIFQCICAVACCVFIPLLFLKDIEIIQTREVPVLVLVCLFGVLLSLLFIVIYVLRLIFTGRIKKPHCYISEEGFQFHGSAVIPWSQIEKVVFVKSSLWDEAWSDEWTAAYLVLRPNGTKRYILCSPYYFNVFGFGTVLNNMKQGFEKYIPVECK